MIKTYTAEEVSQILQKEGFDITKRTVNYYAFEKNMFELSNTGKSCFTDVEIEKIKAIDLLREYTKFTLAQIKQIINTKSYEEIKKLCVERVAKIDPQHYSYITLNAVSNQLMNGTGNANYRNEDSSGNGVYMGSLTSSGSSSAIPSLCTLSTSKAVANLRRVEVDEDFTLLVSNRVKENTVKQVVDYIEFVKSKGGIY